MLLTSLPAVFPRESTATLVLITLAIGILTILASSLRLHREETHGSVKFHPVIRYFFQSILFLATGIRERYWCYAHKVHHKLSDTENDDHSPKNPAKINLLGLKFEIKGALAPGIKYFDLYSKKFSQYGWLKKNQRPTWFLVVTQRFNILGPVLLLGTLLILFGLPGFFMWVGVMLYMPLMAGVVINGIGHSKETSNEHFARPDYSQDIDKIFSGNSWLARIGNFLIGFVLAILTAGENLHGGHHFRQSSARFSRMRWQIDIGWYVIVIMKYLRLASKVRYYPFGSNQVVLL